jgi:hypothetical protein
MPLPSVKNAAATISTMKVWVCTRGKRPDTCGTDALLTLRGFQRLIASEDGATPEHLGIISLRAQHQNEPQAPAVNAPVFPISLRPAESPIVETDGCNATYLVRVL